MKKKLLVVAATAMVASSAMAQSAFEGFYGQISTGYENNKITSATTSIIGTSGVISTNSASFTDQSKSGMPAVIGLGFNYAITKEFLLGIGADYSLISQKTSNATSGVLVSQPASTGSYVINNQQTEVSNRTNIFLTPGYVLNKDALVYLKAGYSQQNLKYSWTDQTGTSSNATNLNAVSASKNVNGYVLGLGYKQMITSGLYGFAEANYYSYGNANISAATNSTSGNNYTVSAPLGSTAMTALIGLGYKF